MGAVRDMNTFVTTTAQPTVGGSWLDVRSNYCRQLLYYTSKRARTAVVLPLIPNLYFRLLSDSARGWFPIFHCFGVWSAIRLSRLQDALPGHATKESHPLRINAYHV